MHASEDLTDFIKVLGGGPHLLPGFIEQLDADAEEFLPCSVMSEEHGMVVVAALISFGSNNNNICQAWISLPKSPDDVISPPQSTALTQFSNLEYLAEYPSEVDGTPAEGTFMLIFATTVFENNLP